MADKNGWSPLEHLVHFLSSKLQSELFGEAGSIQCLEVRKLLDCDVQVSHELAINHQLQSGDSVDFNCRWAPSSTGRGLGDLKT